MRVTMNDLINQSRKDLEELLYVMETKYIQAISSNNVSELEDFYSEFNSIQSLISIQKSTSDNFKIDKLIIIGRMIELVRTSKEIMDGIKVSIINMTCPTKLKHIIQVIGNRTTGVIVSDVLADVFSMNSIEMDNLIRLLNSKVTYQPIECIEGDELNLYFLSKIGQKFYDKYLVRQGD